MRRLKKLTFKNIEKPIAINKQFPNLKLQSLSGKRLEINDFKEKLLLLIGGRQLVLLVGRKFLV